MFWVFWTQMAAKKSAGFVHYEYKAGHICAVGHKHLQIISACSLSQQGAASSCIKAVKQS